MSGSNPGRLFINGFLDKGLVDFEACRTHYETMPPDSLIDEMGFLFSKETLALPFELTANRYYAFLVCLVGCAGNYRDLSDYQRVQLVKMSIEIHQHVRGRTAEDSREAFDVAFSASLDGVRTFGLFPKVAELVASNVRDYDGPFEASPVGEILEQVHPRSAEPMSDVPPVAGGFEYIRDEDRAEYRRFVQHHIQNFPQRAISEVWHYTTAAGLMGILDTQEIWATQISCLNDSLEQRYFGSLVHAEIKLRAVQNTDPNLAVMFSVADDALSKADFAAAGHFVACFSEVEDDLGQWRGYGGGECGYAIGFSVDGIREALKAYPSAAFLQMHYEDKGHASLVQDVLRWAQEYFLQGIERGVPDSKRWALEFLTVFAAELDIFASIIKHPKFSGERERRITALLLPEHFQRLKFSQKRTLLARHLPIALTGSGTPSRLPITRVCVGPGAGQRVSQVSVGDLLRKHGYDNVPIEMSKVPYRVP